MSREGSFVAQIGPRPDFPLPLTDLSYGNSFGYAKRSETESPWVYRRVKLSKDGPYDTKKIYPDLHG